MLTAFLQTVKGAPRFCEHPIIRAIISDMWFSNGLDSYGVKYSGSFSPISLQTLALLVTMVSPHVTCTNAFLIFEKDRILPQRVEDWQIC